MRDKKGLRLAAAKEAVETIGREEAIVTPAPGLVATIQRAQQMSEEVRRLATTGTEGRGDQDAAGEERHRPQGSEGPGRQAQLKLQFEVSVRGSKFEVRAGKRTSLLSPVFTRYAVPVPLCVFSPPCALTGAHGAPAPDFNACVKELRGQATAAGVSAQTFDKAIAGVEPDQSVIDAMDRQPEFITPIWDYLAMLVDEQRIADGRAKLAEWAAVLAEAERKFGVDRHVIRGGVGRRIGLRSRDGTPAAGALAGDRVVLRRPAAVLPRRARRGAAHTRKRRRAARGPRRLVGGRFRPHAVHAVHISPARRSISTATDGATSSDRFRTRSARRRTSSRARAGRAAGRGATRCACPPTTRARRDAARRASWRNGASSESAISTGRRSPARRRGARSSCPPAQAARRSSCSGTSTRSFRTTTRSPTRSRSRTSSDRLRGAGPFAVAWPTNDPGLSRAERRELQTLLDQRTATT